MIRVRGYDLIHTDFEAPPREKWMEKAACLGVDTEVFFDQPNAVDAPAKKICLGNKEEGKAPCPVKQQCLIWTLIAEPPEYQRYGFFGGHGPANRKHIYNALKEKNIV